MGISITFRQMDSSDALKQYVNEKLERVQKYLRSPLDAQATLHQEKIHFVAEIHVQASGRQYHAQHSSDDMYKSIDFVADKIQHQISKAHDAHARSSKGGVSAAEVALASATAVAGEDRE